MVITYSGLEFVKIQSGELTVVFNPVSKESKYNISSPRYRADVALVTYNHPDFNGVSGLRGRDDGGPFVIDTPGEYEVKEIFVKGFGVKTRYGGSQSLSSIYQVILEDISVTFLGSLSEASLDEKVLSELEETDILFIPIGGNGTLGASEAYKLAVKIGSKIVIPIHFDDDPKALEKFLKEEGSDKPERDEKLTIRKSNLLNKDGEIFVLQNSNA